MTSTVLLVSFGYLVHRAIYIGHAASLNGVNNTIPIEPDSEALSHCGVWRILTTLSMSIERSV